jgi:hypothetical protein
MAMKTRFRKAGNPGPRVPAADAEQPRSAEPVARHRPVREEGGPGRVSDAATQRIRKAGGPIDRGFYRCGCGYVFVADVSTTVKCPYCHAGQAW